MCKQLTFAGAPTAIVMCKQSWAVAS